MAILSTSLPDDVMKKLTTLASDQDSSPEELVRDGVERMVAQRNADFVMALEYVLEKNQELYQYLS